MTEDKNEPFVFIDMDDDIDFPPTPFRGEGHYVSEAEAFCEENIYNKLYDFLQEHGANISFAHAGIYYIQLKEKTKDGKEVTVHIHIRKKTVVLRVSYPFEVVPEQFDEVLRRCNHYNAHESWADPHLYEHMYVDDGKVFMVAAKTFEDFEDMDVEKVIWKETYLRLREYAFAMYEELECLAKTATN